ncbi:hypothetical protein pCPXV0250 [Cowpox virus]|uniref:Uncharacterized 8.0 kDa protein n=6 Tax=Orthopoxvirus TaxID=10242 RepID=YVCA_VACCC|nr:RecName: Full=Uncharacterized 8.0 kDa protein [Vaccinia virus Copenhagen]AAF33877.1 unknown [Vaccinia virus Tian Tan]AAW23418.1 hypothetical protein m8024R [Vaccinia virus]ABZ79930.1 unknown [synthetic Vaccinia virus]SNB48780.1 hypothetical protein pCPXV0250 [Cowpox virus]BBD06080.1 putative C ORF A [BAC cloning vector pLC16m8.8S-BAC]
MIERILFPTMSGTSRSPPSYLFIRKNVILDIVQIIKSPYMFAIVEIVFHSCSKTMAVTYELRYTLESHL